MTNSEQQKKEKGRRGYNALYSLFKIIQVLFFPLQRVGMENIPQGAAVVCANHSSYADPVLLALAFTRKYYLRFMAKKELFSVPVLGWAIRNAGAFPVNRAVNDVGAIRTAMRLLKEGEKLMVFPEGTRVAREDATAAKAGAIRLASKLKVPLLPVYIPRKKPLFHKVRIVVGEPYFVDDSGGKGDALAEELMEKINTLRHAAP